MFDRILVPLDGSELAESIFPYLLHLATSLDSELVMLSVNEGRDEERAVGVGVGEAEGWERGLRSRVAGIKSPGIKEYMADVEAHLLEKCVKAEGRFSEGKVAREILRQAEDNGCDLIAMSTRGRSGLERGLLGSVTDEVVRTTRIPVLVSRPGENLDAGLHALDELEMKKLVVPLDGSPLAEVVLPLAEELAKKLSLELVLVRVVRLASLAYAGMECIPVDLGDVQAEMEAEALEYLAGVSARMESAGIKVSTATLKGLPGRAIIEYMEGLDGAMAALSTHCRSGLPRIVLGSVADELIKGLDTPVLVVRPNG